MKNCIKCKADLNQPGQKYITLEGEYYCVGCVKCSFCKEALVDEYKTRSDKPGILSCNKCFPELMKPKGYDANAKAYCHCRKTSELAWKWNGKDWKYSASLPEAPCCIEREREREREREQFSERKVFSL